MAHPLLHQDRIDEPPGVYLAQVGRVFAQFGLATQDSGNVSYGVEAGGQRFFVKTAGPPEGPGTLPHARRVDLLHNAVRVRQACAGDTMPALHAVIASPHGPMLVYAWAQGELLGGPKEWRADPRSAHQRFIALPPERVAAALGDVYALHETLEAAGYVAVDFYDGCLLYDFAAARMHVVDLDMYHHGPFVNDMGRMFGSARFMAPEEFEKGARIDGQTTVFSLGRTAVIFLAGGTQQRTAFRGSDALWAVVEQACRPGRSERFRTVRDFHAAWAAAQNSA